MDDETRATRDDAADAGDAQDAGTQTSPPETPRHARRRDGGGDLAPPPRPAQMPAQTQTPNPTQMPAQTQTRTQTRARALTQLLAQTRAPTQTVAPRRWWGGGGGCPPPSPVSAPLALAMFLVCPWALAAWRALLDAPLRVLFANGPDLGGHGFWAGRAPLDVCATLTARPAAFWGGSPEASAECDALVEQSFESFATGACFLVYSVVAFRAISFWLAHLVDDAREGPRAAHMGRLADLTGGAHAQPVRVLLVGGGEASGVLVERVDDADGGRYQL